MIINAAIIDKACSKIVVKAVSSQTLTYILHIINLTFGKTANKFHTSLHCQERAQVFYAKFTRFSLLVITIIYYMLCIVCYILYIITVITLSVSAIFASLLLHCHIVRLHSQLINVAHSGRLVLT